MAKAGRSNGGLRMANASSTQPVAFLRGGRWPLWSLRVVVWSVRRTTPSDKPLIREGILCVGVTEDPTNPTSCFGVLTDGRG